MKYEITEFTKDPITWVKNERAAEATRPNVPELTHRDSVSLFKVVVISLAALALAAESFLGSIGYYGWW